MNIEFVVSGVLPASQDVVYTAWLNSEEHTRMTVSPARMSPAIGEAFETWDGYIHGKNLELEYPNRILQLWRTTEFKDSDKDSLLEILFESEANGTKIKIRHSGLPIMACNISRAG